MGQREKIGELERRLEALELEKFDALKLNEELRHYLASQKDPDYRELVLMRVLGVVPKGMQKVYFSEVLDSYD